MTSLGEWINNIPKLQEEFLSNSPFSHVIIPSFFSEDFVSQLESEFPTPLNSTLDWKHYDNPIEQKYSLNKFENLNIFTKCFEILQSDQVLNSFKEITKIFNLENDPYLHGAGLHAYPRKGKLDMHLDYSIHPITGKERRCNLIIYMNKNWDNAFGGDLELWDDKLEQSRKSIISGFNTAVLFKTNDISYHGIPKPIECPENEFRKSIAIYYVSEPTENCKPRYKAEFFPLPSQKVSPYLEKLYTIRKSRLITPEDLHTWENWRSEGYGYW